MLSADLYYSLLWCEANGIKVPSDLLARMESLGIKTYDYYYRVLSADVRALYNGKMSEPDFVNALSDLIPQQLRRAWNEGMRDNGLDPAKDLTPEFEKQLQDIIASEFEYVDGFAADVAVAGEQNTGIDPLLTRVDSWANRYNDVVGQSRIVTASKDDHLKWVVGETDHCATCKALENVVALAADWKALRARGIYPKSPELDCHGDHCQCDIVQTDESLTDGGIPI